MCDVFAIKKTCVSLLVTIMVWRISAGFVLCSQTRSRRQRNERENGISEEILSSDC